MRKLSVVVTLLFIVFMLGLPTVPVNAAARTITVRITEAQLNNYIRRSGVDAFNTNVQDTHFVVTEGQLLLVATVSTPGLAAARVTIGFAPTVVNGQIVWAYSLLMYNNTEVALDAFRARAPDPAIMNEFIRPFLANYNLTGYQAASITLTTHVMIIVYVPIGAAAEQPSPPPAAVVTACTVTTNTDLNLRSTPSTSGAVLALVPGNTTLSGTAIQGPWVQVTYKNNQGWLNKGYLQTKGKCS